MEGCHAATVHKKNQMARGRIGKGCRILLSTSAQEVSGKTMPLPLFETYWSCLAACLEPLLPVPGPALAVKVLLCRFPTLARSDDRPMELLYPLQQRMPLMEGSWN